VTSGRGAIDVGVRDEEFGAFVAGRSTALLRTAFLLTGDRHVAEDLLQTALAKTYLAWSGIRAEAGPEAYVRRVLVTTNVSWWRSRRRLPVRTAADLDPGPGLGDGGDRRAVEPVGGAARSAHSSANRDRPAVLRGPQ
jgi:DNA-directed RNA polymerase specialized sigma24 family protein